MLDLFVRAADSGKKIPTFITPAKEEDLIATKDWQTNWKSSFAAQLPNKVALRRTSNGELLGLMSYALEEKSLAVEIIYVESARHSNANMLHVTQEEKKYMGIAKALFAYAVQISLEAGFDGVLIFKAKDSELLNYYIHEFGARQIGSYDPFRLVIWEDAAEAIIGEFRRETDEQNE